MSRVTRYEDSWRTTVAISLGHSFSLAIKESSKRHFTADIVLMDDTNGECFPLGPATASNITNLQQYLETLKGLCP